MAFQSRPRWHPGPPGRGPARGRRSRRRPGPLPSDFIRIEPFLELQEIIEHRAVVANEFRLHQIPAPAFMDYRIHLRPELVVSFSDVVHQRFMDIRELAIPSELLRPRIEAA
jgi:hypothetical protein